MTEQQQPRKPCARGCGRRRLLDDGTEVFEPRYATTGLLCTHDADELKRWLGEIPELYSQLSLYESLPLDAYRPEQHTKLIGSPALIRLDVMSLIDPRSTATAKGQDGNRFGGDVLGVMRGWVECFCETIGYTDPLTTLQAAVDLLTGHWWDNLCAQDWIPDFYRDVHDIDHDLRLATGARDPQPAGRCQCGAKLVYVEGRSIACRRCGHRMDGLAIVRLAEAQRIRITEGAK